MASFLQAFLISSMVADLETPKTVQQSVLDDMFQIQTLAIRIQIIISLMKKELSVLVISDTHEYTDILDKIASKQQGDIFIHVGDFTDYGQEKYFHYFFSFLEKLRFKHKIVISGNHQISLDNGCIEPKQKKAYLHHYPCSLNRQQIIENLKQRSIYLQHGSVQIEGIKIFGSPYTPYFVGNAFQYNEQHEKTIWDCVPEKVDILATHCPPYQIRDKNRKGVCAGSRYLRQVSLNRKPKFHIFGHIHESVGETVINETKYINTAMRPHKFTICP